MAKKRSFGGLIFLTILILGAAGGGYYYWKKAADKPPEVSTVTVTKGEVVQVVTSTGDLQPVLTTDVSSQISGQIVSVKVDYNSKVQKGDVLAELDTATYTSRLKQAEAQLANTQANTNLIRLNYERSKALFDRNLVSQQELDQADAQLQQANAQLQIQVAAVENAKVDLSRCTLYAPIDGVVIDRLAEVGKMVAASLNAPTLFTLVNDLSKMEIKAAVAEADIGNVQEGQDVTFTVDAYPNRTFRGKVEQLRNLPTTAQSVVTYATIIAVHNEDLKLKPGMTANVSIIIARKSNVLKIPNSALRARVAEEYQLPAAARANDAEKAPSAPSAKAATPEQLRQLMTDAGISFGGGTRPTPEQFARARELAKERNLELPENFGRRGPRAGGGGGGENTNAVTVRTVYKQVGTAASPKAQPVTVKLGITDGSSTEVIEGLSEGDVLVTSIASPNAPAVQTRPGGSNPFGGGGGGPSGRRGGF